MELTRRLFSKGQGTCPVTAGPVQGSWPWLSGLGALTEHRHPTLLRTRDPYLIHDDIDLRPISKGDY